MVWWWWWWLWLSSSDRTIKYTQSEVSFAFRDELLTPAKAKLQGSRMSAYVQSVSFLKYGKTTVCVFGGTKARTRLLKEHAVKTCKTLFHVLTNLTLHYKMSNCKKVLGVLVHVTMANNCPNHTFGTMVSLTFLPPDFHFFNNFLKIALRSSSVFCPNPKSSLSVFSIFPP